MRTHFTPTNGIFRNLSIPKVQQCLTKLTIEFGTKLTTCKGVILTGLLLLFVTYVNEISAQIEAPCSCMSYHIIGDYNEVTNISDVTVNNAICQSIRGTLVINVTTNWDNVEARMEEGSQIIVNQDVTFRVYNHSYISGCDNMWLGIYVNSPDPPAPPIPPHVGGTLILEESTIEDAWNGVNLSNQVTFGCTDMSFANNYIGIAAGSPFVDNEPISVFSLYPITGCTFYTHNSLPEPCEGTEYEEEGWPDPPNFVLYNTGYCAVFMRNATGLSLGKATDENPTNEVFEMRNGVILINSMSYISSTYFHDFTGGVPTMPPHYDSGIPDYNQVGVYSERSHTKILSNEMEDVMVGISGKESNDNISMNFIQIYNGPGSMGRTKGITEERPQDLSIVNNRIFNGFEGIHVMNGTRPFNIQLNILQRLVSSNSNEAIHVEACHIAGSTLGLISQNYITIYDGNMASGIGLNEVTGIKAVDNSISFEVTNFAGQHNKGIYLINGTSCVIGQNTLIADSEYNDDGNVEEDMNIGIDMTNNVLIKLQCNEFTNFNTNMRMIASNINSDVKSNLFYEAGTGFNLYAPANIGMQEQKGNQWLANYDDFGAFISVSDQSVDPVLDIIATLQNSSFIVDDYDNGGIFRPSPIGPSLVSDHQWFRHSSGDGIACLNYSNPIFPSGSIITQLVRTGYEYETYNDEMTWISWAGIYDLLLIHDSLLIYTPLDSFFSIQEDLPLGKLMQIRHDINHIESESFSEKLELEEKNQVLLHDLIYIDSILSLNPIDKLDWLDLRSLKLDSLNDNYNNWRVFIDGDSTSFASQCESSLEILDTLTVSNDLEDLLRSALIYKCKYLLTDSLSTSDSTSVVNSIELCPWQGGYTLGLENELFSRVADSLTSFTVFPCEEPIPFQIFSIPNTLTSNEQLHIYPNPATDFIRIISPDVIHEIQLIDLTSKVIRQSLSESNNFNIAIEDLPSGIYILNIFHGGLMETNKIVISK